MAERWTKWVVVLLMAMIVGVPFLLRPATPEEAPGAETLIVLTPHNEQIRYEFARAFNAWRSKQGKPPVAFDWRSSGGTADLRRNLLSQFEAIAQRSHEARGIGVDLFWGGGDFEHNLLAAGPTVRVPVTDETGRARAFAVDRDLVSGATLTLTWTLGGEPDPQASPIVGLQLTDPDHRFTLLPDIDSPASESARGVVVTASVWRDDRVRVEVRVRNTAAETVTLGGAVLENGAATRAEAVTGALTFPVTIPAQVPPELLAEAFPEPTIGGEPLYHPELRWVGVVLSSFGIVYNHDLLVMLNAPTPDTWRDLAIPQLRGWVALADPSHAGSIAATYNVILRRSGWEEGWALLRQVFANARYFTSSASKVPVDVSAGEAAAGMCIDFYGRFQAGAVVSPDGQSRVGYVDPPFMTATTADPVSIVRGAPHEELAHEFVRYLLSVEAQRLWQRKRGAPDGPERFELRRLPVRHDLYTREEAGWWADPEADPWSYTRPIPHAMPSFQRLVGPVSHAMAIDVHADLAAAWQAILETPRDHPRLAEMLQLFHAMPDDLTIEWPDSELREQWAAALQGPQHPRFAEAEATLQGFAARLTKIAADPDQRLAKQLEWTLFFRTNYQRVLQLSRQ